MKLEKSKWIAGTCVMLTSAMMMTACGGTTQNSTPATPATSQGGSASAQKVTLTFWDNNPGPQTTPLYQELIKRFEQQNPNITVEYVGIPSASAQQKYDTAVASHQEPDIANVYDRWLADFAVKGALVPLDTYFNSWSEKDKIQTIYTQGLRDLAPDKKLYLLPNTVVLSVVWYNTELFKAAGLPVPKTWDDFFADAAKLTDTAKQKYGFTLRGGPSSVVQLEQELWSYSGVNTYFDAKGNSTINNPKNVEFVQKLAELYQKKYAPESDVTNNYQQMVSEFDSGTAAMMMHNQSSYAQHQKTLGDGKFDGAFLFPGPDGKTVEAPSVGGLSIFKDSKHPDEAWKFVSFMGSAESQGYYDNSYSDIPTNSDAKVEMPILKTGLQVMGSSNTILIQPPTYLPDYAQIQSSLEPDFQAVLYSKMTAQQFMDKWAKLLTDSKAKYDAAVKK